jgi:hypothetical protein
VSDVGGRRTGAGRHELLGMARLKTLGERACLVVHIPIERRHQHDALRCRQAERAYIVLPDDQRQQLLLLAKPEFGGLFERIAGVTTRIGECDRVGFRAMRLQQQRGEIVGLF